jgi:hypothetical protein
MLLDALRRRWMIKGGHMRKFILMILFFGVCGLAQADIVGNTLSKELTEKGFIKVTTKFIDDKNTIDKSDDEQVGTLDHRLWNPLLFDGKTGEEINAIIRADLEEKAKGNTIYQYMKKKGGNPLVLMREEKAQAIYDKLPKINIEVKRVNLTTKMDINGDGYCEEEWTINPDGTESRVSITPQSCK